LFPLQTRAQQLITKLFKKKKKRKKKKERKKKEKE